MFWLFVWLLLIFYDHFWESSRAIFNYMPMWKFCLSLPLIVLFLCWMYLNVYEIYILSINRHISKPNKALVLSFTRKIYHIVWHCLFSFSLLDMPIRSWTVLMVLERKNPLIHGWIYVKYSDFNGWYMGICPFEATTDSSGLAPSLHLGQPSCVSQTWIYFRIAQQVWVVMSEDLQEVLFWYK